MKKKNRYPYSKWNPCGNTTLFFAEGAGPDAYGMAQALGQDGPGAEQAGFVDEKNYSLRMAGGEFCVNASRAFGALLDRARGKPETEARRCTVSVSGWPGKVALSVTGAEPLWHVTAELSLPGLPPLEEKGRRCLARVPGISHLLAGEDEERPQGDIRPSARRLLERHCLLEEEAAGVIWWKRLGLRNNVPAFAIWPVVRVRDVDTLYAETSCGSGSLALACLGLYRGWDARFEILQPGGDWLSVSFESLGAGLQASVGGPVEFVEEGVWSPRD